MAKATIADYLAKTLAFAGVERIWGVTGDSLNGLAYSLKRDDKIRWMYTRHDCSTPPSASAAIASRASGAKADARGIYEYLKPRAWGASCRCVPKRRHRRFMRTMCCKRATSARSIARPSLLGGKQARPDSGYSRLVHALSGAVVGEVGEGNRKDIRNAVAAARAMTK